MMNSHGLMLAAAGTPLLVNGRRARAYMDRLEAVEQSRDGVMGGIRRALGRGHGERQPPRPKSLAPHLSWSRPVERLDGFALVDGIAVIDVAGILSSHTYYDWLEDRWNVGYTDLGAALANADASERVRGVFLRVDSVGGFTSGCMELSAFIRDCASRKPIWAYATCALSAAYDISSACTRIVAQRAADVGSIGVYMLHEDRTALIERSGVRIEAVENLPGKTNGQDWKPLDEETRADMQAVVDQIATDLFQSVATGRPALTPEVLTSLNARTFLAFHSEAARSGLSLGLVDEIAVEHAAFASLVASLEPSKGASARGKKPTTIAVAMKEGAMLTKMLKSLRTKAKRGHKPSAEAVERIDAILDDDSKSVEDQISEVEDVVSEVDAGDEDVEPGETATVDDVAGILDDEDLSDDDKLTKIRSLVANDDEPAEPAARSSRRAPRARGRDGFDVLALPSAKGREALAASLGRKVSAGKLTIDEADEMLGKAPKAGRLTQAMEGRSGGIPPAGKEREAPKRGGLAADMKRRIGRA
jgi:capsid assembly protease